MKKIKVRKIFKMLSFYQNSIISVSNIFMQMYNVSPLSIQSIRVLSKIMERIEFFIYLINMYNYKG